MHPQLAKQSPIRRKQLGTGLIIKLILVGFLGLGSVWGLAVYQAAQTLDEMFAENRRLKEAISNLTHESQIGYAKVMGRKWQDGELQTTLKFVETAPNNPQEKLREVTYTISGDVVHFDALIVTFNDQMVMDGDKRALYIWRRVYGDKMAPEQGFPIEMPGEIPARYRDLFGEPSLMDKLLLKEDEATRFWDAIWDLADDPDRLKRHGVEAIYGNAVYTRLKPGLIYIFKISANGRLSPEVVPDL
jgi:hypothetical protein